MSPHGLGGLAGLGESSGLPQLLGVPAMGVHAPGYRLHPALRHRRPALLVHPLPARVQAQEPAERGLLL